MTSVLIVEDESQLLRALAINLRARQYDVQIAADGATALRLAGRRPPDLVILDLGLPDIDGIDVIHGLRGWTQIPIVVLSARQDQADKVAALDAGADDYLTKPFGMDELLARLRAALRRANAEDHQPAITIGAFTVDLAAKTVTGGSEPVRLTPTEWHLLEVLVRNTAKLVGQPQLLRELWGPGYETQTNYLRVYMAQLRRKLETNPSRPQHLLTEPGLGYRFQP
jgi:two-component system, OmpR family, KDP operon response regulator KdpE